MKPTEEKTRSNPSDLPVYLFKQGNNCEAYRYFGAHIERRAGETGVVFRVWAPHATAISVVGDFNSWKPGSHPMRKVDNDSVWELFIPGMKEYDVYKYCVTTRAGDLVYKADPYAFHAETRPSNGSKVYDLNGFVWHDEAWQNAQKKADVINGPMNIYEMHAGSWKQKEGGLPYNYSELADELIPYITEMGYTHVELLPVMEYPFDGSWGYQVTGYFAPTSRYGTPKDLMAFVDKMHEAGIGVIMDWVPAHFPKDQFGLYNFDGEACYEDPNPKRGEHKEWGTMVFDFGRSEVQSFLISSALYWLEQYHIDGLRVDAVASMLYLDYNRKQGEWEPNKDGGKENLEAVAFLRKLNDTVLGRHPHKYMIAEESTAWPMVTKPASDGGLGFNFKWNMGWMNDFTNYMRCDPLFRKNNYGELTFSMLYAYSENFILVFSHDEVVHGKGSMIGKMPGSDLEQKAENLRAAYGFMMGHPGKKLLFMGQDFAQVREWNENASLDWELLETDTHRQIQDYMKALNELYRKYPAMYAMDYDPEGFQWINCSYQQESMIIFVRKTKKPEESLLFVCNFDNMAHEKFRVGVPFEGKYKEILSSNAAEFGGSGAPNPRVKTSRKLEWDDLENSIEINVAPMSVSIFTCTPEAAPKKARKAETGKAKKAGTRAEAGTAAGKAGKAAAKAAGQAEGEKKPGAAGAAVKSAPKAAKAGKPAAAKTAQEPADGAVKVEKPATAEKPKKAAASKAKAGEPAAAKPETAKAEGKLPDAAGGQEKPAIEKVKKPDAAKEGQKRLTTAKEEQKKLTTAKEEQKKLSTAKEEQKKLSTAKEEPKKLSTAKRAQKKLATVKEELKKLAAPKEENDKDSQD